MAPVAMITGLLLSLLGVVGYYLAESNREVGSDPTSLTAFIPTGFGVALLLLGALAFKDSLRKHAMHLAALVGTLGCLGGIVMTVLALVKDAETALGKSRIATMSKASMGLLCGIFVFLCVKSFIDVRKARQAREAANGK